MKDPKSEFSANQLMANTVIQDEPITTPEKCMAWVSRICIGGAIAIVSFFAWLKYFY